MLYSIGNIYKSKIKSGYANSSLQRFIKRSFDIICSLISILVFLPVIVIIYILIYAQRDGKVIFKQERIGKGGKPFNIYKFRTMKENAEANGVPQLYCQNDARLTKIGKFLRNHHLDEFPQLWNVLKGDMSFVGPRPERKFFIDQIMEYNPGYERLYAIRPGLFSKATLYNGYTDTMEKMLDRLRYDLEYLDNQSLMLDIKIIFLTTYNILTGKKI